jgi:carbon storage regulator
MLVLTRRIGETVVIDGGITVTVVAVQGNKVRLGINAPAYVRVDREEVHESRSSVVDQGGTPARSEKQPVGAR